MIGLVVQLQGRVSYMMVGVGTLKRTHRRCEAVVKRAVAGGLTRRWMAFYSVYSRYLFGHIKTGPVQVRNPLV